MEQTLEIVPKDEVRPTAAEVEAAGQQAFDFAPKALPPSPLTEHAATELMNAAEPDETSAKQLFGDWLLAQKDRKGWIGELSRAFEADRNFPRRGDPDDVRKYLREVRAEGDAYEALDDAELDWASY